MILLDTDTFGFLIAERPRVADRFRAATDQVAITIITRIEVLDGRFAFVRKAADGDQLLRAQEWLRRSEKDLARFPVVPLNAGAAAEFDQLRDNRRLRKIGRGDLLIACIAL
ncbi:MAG TPA: type II toxin-antitoxin system VapC family toxin, partial [Gemmataceae bacterium]|nr:type II toxin-antitoxin system VapC family toxin [Gemmataceae bacterium]